MTTSIRRFAIAGLFAGIPILAALTASASCLSQCSRVCRYDDNVCKSCNSNCLNRCVNLFGAIVDSASVGAFGYTAAEQSQRQAEQVAIRYCRRYGGDDCSVQVWFENSCGALATGSHGSAWAASRGEAERESLEECEQQGSGPCKGAAFRLHW
jgi:hypothetical protein